MCSTCSPLRTCQADTHHHASPLPDSFATRTRVPVNRRQFLQGLGAGLASAFALNPLARTRALAASMPYVVLIVLDGARPDYFNVKGIPRVKALIKNGTQYTNAFAGILESETPSGHATIATGSMPSKHRILSFWWADSHGVKIDLFNPDKIRAGYMEDIVRQAGVPTLAGQVHAANRKASVVAVSGSKYYAADALGGPDANIIMYFSGTADGHFAPTAIPAHSPPAGILTAHDLIIKNGSIPLGVENHLAMKLAVKTFRRTHQHVTLINLPEFDWPLGHVNGGIADQHGVTTLMRAFDRDLGMLEDALLEEGVLDRTLFVLMGDHGMMQLAHKVDADVLTSAVTRGGGTIATSAFSTGAYFWLKDPSRATAAAQQVAALRDPFIQSVYAHASGQHGPAYGRVTSGALLRTAAVEGANQDLLHSFNGPNAPHVVVLFREGVGSEPGGQAGWHGDHGGASWEAQHMPLIFSGPGIRSGLTSPFPARLIDVAPTVLQAMGISNGGMQGAVLADALLHPPEWATYAQRTLGPKLLPVVHALQQESHLERR